MEVFGSAEIDSLFFLKQSCGCVIVTEKEIFYE